MYIYIHIYIYLGQSQTTIISVQTWCEGFSFRRISLMSNLASSYFQESEALQRSSLPILIQFQQMRSQMKT